VAEWSCSGLQSRLRRFDSDPSLHSFVSRHPLESSDVENRLPERVSVSPLTSFVVQWRTLLYPSALSCEITRVFLGVFAWWCLLHILTVSKERYRDVLFNP
jgi:hypothetical protein